MVHTYKFNVSLEESSDFLFFGELEKMNLKNKIMFNILYVQYGINRGWYKLLNLLYSVQPHNVYRIWRINVRKYPFFTQSPFLHICICRYNCTFSVNMFICILYDQFNSWTFFVAWFYLNFVRTFLLLYLSCNCVYLYF